MSEVKRGRGRPPYTPAQREEANLRKQKEEVRVKRTHDAESALPPDDKGRRPVGRPPLDPESRWKKHIQQNSEIITYEDDTQEVIVDYYKVLSRFYTEEFERHGHLHRLPQIPDIIIAEIPENIARMDKDFNWWLIAREGQRRNLRLTDDGLHDVDMPDCNPDGVYLMMPVTHNGRMTLRGRSKDLNIYFMRDLPGAVQVFEWHKYAAMHREDSPKKQREVIEKHFSDMPFIYIINNKMQQVEGRDSFQAAAWDNIKFDFRFRGKSADIIDDSLQPGGWQDPCQFEWQLNIAIYHDEGGRS